MGLLKRLFGVGGEPNLARVFNVMEITGLPLGAQMAFSPDERFLAIGGEKLQIWNIEPPERIALIETQARVSCLSFTPDGTKLLAGLTNGTVEFWSTAEWTRAESLVAHQDTIYGIAVERNEGKYFATCSGKFEPTRARTTDDADLRVRIWDLRRRTPLKDLTGHVTVPGRLSNGVQAVEFGSADTVTSLGHDGTIIRWNIMTGDPISRVPPDVGPFKQFACVNDGVVAIGKTVYFPPGVADSAITKRLQRRKAGGVASSGDRRYFVLSSGDGKSGAMVHEADIWDTALKKYRSIVRINGLLGPPNQLSLSAKGLYFAYSDIEIGGRTSKILVLRIEGDA